MNESRRRAAATWGLIAAAAAGAVGASGFALSEGRVDLTVTESAGPTGFAEAPLITTTTTAAPGLKSAPVNRTTAGAGSHTSSHGS